MAFLLELNAMAYTGIDDGADLSAAVLEFVADSNTTESKYGEINTWDTAGVTNMDVRCLLDACWPLPVSRPCTPLCQNGVLP